jgi:ribosomal protein L23
MEHKNVYYINVKPYDNKIPINVALKHYYGNQDKQMECLRKAHEIYRQEVLRGEEKSEEEYEVDVVIGKYITQHIHDFFRMHNKRHNGTRRKRHHRHRNTAKK